MAISANSWPKPPRQHSIAPDAAAKPSALSIDAPQWLAAVVAAHALAITVVALRHAAASQPPGDPTSWLTYCITPTTPVAITAAASAIDSGQGFPVADKYQWGPKGVRTSFARVPPNRVSATPLSPQSHIMLFYTNSLSGSSKRYA